ncbi:5-oxopent-3-ene-1,2,5-tricarboxylate decarboxylase [Cupriavidus sp. SK-4]|uniref:fumarylacetoacetate hydrolase family protein n=1 Tax=Cupriavidus sp. SK-4 TaxID=574750 RepID=UPI00044B1E81|nr:fumarylacetoacetate hydrolase family protein [Cupriavidus sp. SK-4]EYS85108.1 5-oxopent-3-ene-1,2,5-tricarboxylate decarboxylase [Cupriavidus sp. SK-4]
MKLATFLLDGRARVGVVSADGVLALPEAAGNDVGALVAVGTDSERWRALYAQATPVAGADSLTWLPPVARPPKILCVGLNYADHTKESPYEQPDYPTLFLRVATSLVGHNGAIVRPLVSDSLDYEGELAVIIGKGGRHIARDEALGHVFGYSIFNDGSVREYQFKSPQWTVGKNFDATGSFGPVVVTADELPPGAAGLQLETRLNGQVVQSASTSDMLYDVASLIAIISEAITLEPGDVIVAGTPSGIGWARKPQLLMRHGDVCEVSIEGIGTLSNPIVDERGRAAR